jgi:hypothetical protein
VALDEAHSPAKPFLHVRCALTPPLLFRRLRSIIAVTHKGHAAGVRPARLPSQAHARAVNTKLEKQASCECPHAVR